MSTDTPITWQIVLFLQERLQAISTTNGFRTDVGTSVFVEKHQFTEGDPPFIEVSLSKTSRSGGGGVSPTQRSASLLVEGFVPTGVNNTNANETAHKILADIEEVFSTRADQFSDLVKALVVTDSNIDPTPDGLNAVVVSFTATANYKPAA